MGIVRRCPRNIFSICALASKRRFSFDDGAFGDCSFGPDFWSKHPVPFFLRATSCYWRMSGPRVRCQGHDRSRYFVDERLRLDWSNKLQRVFMAPATICFRTHRVDTTSFFAVYARHVYCVMLPLAYLSWRFVEVPWRSKASAECFYLALSCLQLQRPSRVY